MLMVNVVMGLLGRARLVHLKVLGAVGILQRQRLESHARGSAKRAAAEFHVVVLVVAGVIVLFLLVAVGDGDGRGSEADSGAADDGLWVDAELP